jgi:hypothetical protein
MTVKNNAVEMLATSAVPNMTVAEVRKALFQLRELWNASSETQPLWICNELMNGTSIANFATELVYGHHLKRHLKSTSYMQTGGGGGNGGVGGLGTGTDRDPYFDTDVISSATTLPTSPVQPRVARPGPKGTLDDPFPFTPAWKPRTELGKTRFQTFQLIQSESRSTRLEVEPEPEPEIVFERESKPEPEPEPEPEKEQEQEPEAQAHTEPVKKHKKVTKTRRREEATEDAEEAPKPKRHRHRQCQRQRERERVPYDNTLRNGTLTAYVTTTTTIRRVLPARSCRTRTGVVA